MGNPLKSLLQDRHLHAYSDFVAEYERCARGLDLPRRAPAPTKAQYYRWVGGQLESLPRGYHCAVLERMFPGWTAQELFGRADRQQRPPPPNSELLTPVRAGVELASLAGLWVTCYLVDNCHHVDLSTITITEDAVTAKNYPPQSRIEGHASGYANDIAAGLFGRHLIGQWRNVNDRYFYGSIHLAVLPGEMVLDGYYTAVATDTAVTAGRWRWVRVEPGSADGVDLSTVALGEPHRLHEVILGRTRFEGPIPLNEVTEAVTCR